MELEQQALEIIKKSKDGVFQNELWKIMDIDSRKCSRIVSNLLKDDLITRESAVSNGARTYLLKAVEEKEVSYDLLLAGDIFSPCAGCRDACQPEYCAKLADWVNNLPVDDISSED